MDGRGRSTCAASPRPPRVIPNSPIQPRTHPARSNFILYPKEDKDERRLVYYCRSSKCDHEEAAPDPYVFRNQVVKTRTYVVE